MANLRSLKKDIDYLLSMVLEECMYVIEAYPDADKEKVLDLARKIIVSHRNLRLRVNHIDGKADPKKVKEYLKKIVDDLYGEANSSLEELSVLIKQL
jgi:hypothetical protein